MVNKFAAAAAGYARAGIHVLPCDPANKSPCGDLVPQDIGPDRKRIKGSGGLKKASCDSATILDWWQVRPDAMIGIRTGEISGFFAIDQDRPKQVKNAPIGTMSPDGVEAWKKLAGEHGGHGPTIEITTPTGGLHTWFRYDPNRPVTNSEGRLSGLGIDVRGNGGYVIGPPSVRTDGAAYVANRNFDLDAIAPAPDWLYELLSPQSKPDEGRPHAPAHLGPATDFPPSDRNRNKLKGALSVIPSGERLTWLRIGAALNTLEPEWGVEAMEIWDEWSKTSPKFDQDDQDLTWQEFDPTRQKVATIATIFFEAKQRGWTNSEDAAEGVSAGPVDMAIAALAAMPLAQYERARKDEATRLGVRASILDKLVAAERKEDCTGGQGRQLVLPEPEPWHEPVDGAVLLIELRNTIKEFLVCSSPKAAAIALWIAATWFEPAAQVAPILNIRSPLPRCGKTTLLDFIRRLSKRPLAASSITPAALFRTVEKCCPTLVIDEADSFFSENEEMRGVLNSGHTRQTAFVIRTVGDDHEPRQFSTWGFKAIAGIGKRAGTIEDRSIAIDLERKLRDEPVSRLRHAPGGLFTALQQKLCRWSSDNGQAVAGARPILPDTLDDRQQDNWEILAAIADRAGGDWPDSARNAAVSLSGTKDDTAPLGVQLLDDVQEIVNTSAQERGVYSQVLLDRLIAMPERPWGECNHWKPLTLNRLAKMMGAFGLKTKDLKIAGTVQKGYGIPELQAAFARYCTPTTGREPDTGFQSATPLPVNYINGLPENKSATSSLENNEALPHLTLINQDITHKGSGVALQTPETGDGDEGSVYGDLGGCEF